MNSINFKKEINESVEGAISKIESALRPVGFGILTRIDFDKKIKEKLQKDISPVVILGACNPQLAFEAYSRNTDVTSLLPCNVVIREIAKGRVSVELMKPSKMLAVLGDKELTKMAEEADLILAKTLENL